MDIVAAILLFGAAVSGFMAFVHLSMEMQVGRKLRLFHAVLVAAGIVALILYAMFTNDHEKHINVLVMLGIAVIPGLFLLRGKSVTHRGKGLAVTYGLTGLFALLWLLTYLIPQ